MSLSWSFSKTITFGGGCVFLCLHICIRVNVCVRLPVSVRACASVCVVLYCTTWTIAHANDKKNITKDIHIFTKANFPRTTLIGVYGVARIRLVLCDCRWLPTDVAFTRNTNKYTHIKTKTQRNLIQFRMTPQKKILFIMAHAYDRERERVRGGESGSRKL